MTLLVDIGIPLADTRNTAFVDCPVLGFSCPDF